FHQHLNAALAADSPKRHKVALLMPDPDKFKQLNDTLGHACGDRLLCAVADRLTALAEGVGLVARLSGDELAVVIRGPDAGAAAERLAALTSAAFAKSPFSIGDRPIRINASIGVGFYPDYGATADELFGNA